MSFANLIASYNKDLYQEVTRPKFMITTGTYVAWVLKVEEQVNRFDGETPELSLTLQLFDDDFERIGRTWLTITPVEKRNQSGRLSKPSVLFYELMKVLGSADIEAFLDDLANASFMVHGNEVYRGPAKDFPESLRDEDLAQADKWQTVYVNADEDNKRDLLLDAGLKSRFQVSKVGVYREA